MAMLSNLFGCFCLWADPEPSDLAENHTLNNTKNGPYQDGANEAEIAHDIVAKLFAAQKHDVILKADLQTTIRARGWYESLAAAVLATLVRAIELKAEMGPAMKDAYGKASTAISQNKEWAGKHPKMTEVIITLIALGILALMMPWLMVYLGFTEDGIFKASWAARWQATHQGFVPKGALFSYLQSLGTKIGGNWHGYDHCLPERTARDRI